MVDGAVAEVRNAHGGTYVSIALEEWSNEAVAGLRASPLVAQVREEGSDLAVMLRRHADPQDLLEDLVRRRVRVRRFERVVPSLEQIFIERVGAEAAAGLDAAKEVQHV